MKIKTLTGIILFTLMSLMPISAEETPYSHTSSKGKTYYLYSREQKLKNSDKVITMYFFAKTPKHEKGTPVYKVPGDRLVSETKTGLLVLKKKK